MPNPQPVKDDNKAVEMYSNFPEDYRVPTIIQHTLPTPRAAHDTNFEPRSENLTPAHTSIVAEDATTSPRPPVEDRPNCSLPKRLNITRDRFLQSIGHINLDKLIRLLPQLMKENTIHIQQDSNPQIDIREHATIKNAQKSKKPVKLPDNYGDVWHIDIGFFLMRR